MRKISALIFSAVAIAMAASLGATSALAQEGLFQYAGPSTTARTGGQGYFVFHDDCAAAIDDSTWCTSQMIIEGGPAPDAPSPAELGEWLNPVYFAYRPTGDRIIDISEQSAPIVRSLSCFGWTSASNSQAGLVLRTLPSSTVVSIQGQDCNVPLRAACCVESD